MLFKADLYLKLIFLPTLLLCNTAFYLSEVSLRVDWKCRYYAPLNQNNTEWTYRNLFYEHSHTMKADGRWTSCVTVQVFSNKISSSRWLFSHPKHCCCFFSRFDNQVFDMSQWHIKISFLFLIENTYEQAVVFMDYSNMKQRLQNVQIPKD